MKYFLILAFVFLTGCSTVVPVKQKFPEPPGKLAIEGCPDLQKLSDNSSLSDILKTVTKNYTTYYECVIKVDAWIEWYNIQKEISETANK